MNLKRISVIISYFILGLVSALVLFRFLGLRLFHFSVEFGNVMHSIIFYSCLVCTVIGALAFALSKRNRIFLYIMPAFLLIIILFLMIL